MEHPQPGPCGRVRMRKQRRRAADRFVLDFAGEKQEILQGFLGKSLWTMGLFCSFFLPRTLKARDAPLQARTEVAETLCFLLGHLEGLTPFTGFTAEQSIQPCFYLSPSCLLKNPQGDKAVTIPSHLQHRWRYRDLLLFMGIAFPLPVCFKGHHHILCSGTGPAPPGYIQHPRTSHLEKSLTRDFLASFNWLSQHPSQVDIIILLSAICCWRQSSPNWDSDLSCVITQFHAGWTRHKEITPGR